MYNIFLPVTRSFVYYYLCLHYFENTITLFFFMAKNSTVYTYIFFIHSFSVIGHLVWFTCLRYGSNVAVNADVQEPLL